MPKRNVSFLGQSGLSESESPGKLKMLTLSPFVSRWRNYSIIVWRKRDKWMLQLELEESWSTDENYLRFKRIPFDESLVPQLTRRQQGFTHWPDESIIMLGVNIVKRGPPFTAASWHLFWPDHQSFIEELSDKIINNPKPRPQPLPLLVYRGEEALRNFDKRGPPMAFSFGNGDDTIGDDYTGGKGMLRAYPGGPNRIPKPSLARR
ncbi:hypothetical protein Clacol_000934 [Clathrus columnatus]|uniref:Uncharacterized protein n=1 Tax=Clathrus columnatus TaxID=1419009 RepID=A0AAV4ZZS8_9AGAM|nr:hypothetical protein Clacol_000934 [Clathrus columnatus]